MRQLLVFSIASAALVLGQLEAGPHWATDYTPMAETQTLYGSYWNFSDPDSDHVLVVCTQFRMASMMFRFKYELTGGGLSDWQELYIPPDVTLLPDNSTCLNPDNYTEIITETGELSSNDGAVVHAFSTQATFTFGDGAGSFVLYFSNNSNAPYYVPGWFQFALYRLDLTLNMEHPNMTLAFPNAANPTETFSGWSNNSDPDNGRWWKKFGAYSGYSFSCNTRLKIEVEEDRLYFYFQDMRVSALNYADEGYSNDTLPENVCNFDYEKNDSLAVILGSVQTGFTLAFLFAYFVYLKKRGPVKVPKWIVEPAMRNAEVKPIDDAEFERRLSQMPPEEANGGTLTKRNIAAANGADNNGMVPDESF